MDELSTDNFIDTTYQWRGSNGTQAHCRLRLFPRPGHYVLILTEMDTNTGISVTNDAEHLATLLLADYGLSARSVIWIEHYSAHSYAQPGDDETDTYDLIQFNWDGERFSAPRWCRLTHTEVNALAGQQLPETVVLESGKNIEQAGE